MDSFANMLPLIQLMDSALPTGAFAHSFGLETLIQEERIGNAQELLRWLTGYIEGTLSPVEGVGVYWAWQYAESLRAPVGSPGEAAFGAAKITLLDERLTLMRLARESREGGMKVARRYLRLLLDLYPDSGLRWYDKAIQAGTCYGSVPVVHGFICVFLGHSVATAIASHLYASVNAMIQNALRAMSLGQTDGQRVLRDITPVLTVHAERLVNSPTPMEEFGSSGLMQEIAAMRHESLYSRLFMS